MRVEQTSEKYLTDTKKASISLCIIHSEFDTHSDIAVSMGGMKGFPHSPVKQLADLI